MPAGPAEPCQSMARLACPSAGRPFLGCPSTLLQALNCVPWPSEPTTPLSSWFPCWLQDLEQQLDNGNLTCVGEELHGG